jgi:hypothetical protein
VDLALGSCIIPYDRVGCARNGYRGSTPAHTAHSERCVLAGRRRTAVSGPPLSAPHQVHPPASRSSPFRQRALGFTRRSFFPNRWPKIAPCPVLPNEHGPHLTRAAAGLGGPVESPKTKSNHPERSHLWQKVQAVTAAVMPAQVASAAAAVAAPAAAQDHAVTDQLVSIPNERGDAGTGVPA